MMISPPQLSIITIHLNNFIGLEETRNSLSKSAPNSFPFEWIVIDGDSDLKTAHNHEILNKTRLQASQFISEIDQSIYDAMNKGAKLATGDYILFINSGDLIHPDLNWDLLNMAMENEPDMIWGQCVEEYTNGEMVAVKTRTPAWAWYRLPVHHAATIYKREILPEPTFDVSYKIGGDYDLLLKLLTNDKTKINYHQSPISIFRHGGISGTQWKTAILESQRLRETYYGFGKYRNYLVTLIQNFSRKLSQSAKFRRLWRSKI